MAHHQLTDSLALALASQKGSERLGTQLQLALELSPIEKDRALNLSRQALKEARKAGNKELETRALFVLGRTNQVHEQMGLAEAYYDSALVLANSTGSNRHKGELLHHMGLILYNKGMAIEALESYNQALHYNRLAQNFRLVGSGYSMMANIYRVNGLYDRAIEYIIKSKLNYEKANFVEGNAWAAYMLGRIYADLKLRTKAREYFNESLEIYRQVAASNGDKSGLAICYEQLGLLDLASGDLNQASAAIDHALRIFSENQSKYGISNAYLNFGRIEYARGDYVAARNYLSKALSMKQEIADRLSLTRIHEYLGLCDLAQGKQQQGLSSLHEGLELALKTNQKKVQLDIYAKLSETYLKMKNLPKAFEAQQKQIDVQNELLSGAVNIKLEQLQPIYALDAKNEQIAELEQTNAINKLQLKQHRITRMAALSAVLIVVLIASSVYLVNRKIRKKNAALHEAVQTKDRLFSIIAHDLRNPIGTSLGLSEFLLEEMNQKNYTVVSHYAGLFRQSLTEAFNLLNNLLDWSRSQQQRIRFEARELVLADIISESRELFESSIQQKNLAFDVQTPENCRVLADPDMLKTILRNLLSNAIKFSNENGLISLMCQPNGQFAEIAITDRGVGMSPEQQAALFAFDTNSSTPGTAGEKGTGLGLILVKEFVEKHGGYIRLSSKPGQGSTFSFTIPMA